MRTYTFFVCLFTSMFVCTTVTAKKTPFYFYRNNNDSRLNKTRLATVSISQAVVTGGMFYVLNEAWYKDYERSKFHFKDDMGVWNQVDKVGHAYSTYTASGIIAEVYKWTGLSNNKSAIIGAGSSLLTLTAIEFLDAYSAEWGFSYGDMLTNVAGSGLYLGQELIWQEQRIQLKYGINYKKYPTGDLSARVKQVYGDNLPERLLKDYNAQSYWLSVDVHSFYKSWPKWLNIAVGYSAEDMYGAYYNTWKDVDGVYHDYSDIHRYRQWLLSLDVNFANIETGNRFFNAFLDVLTIKVPAPALEYNSKGKLKFHPIFF